MVDSPLRPPRGRRAGLVTFAALLLLVGSRAWASPETDYKLAVGYYNGEKYAEAAEYFQKFLAAAPKADPDVPTARFFLGMALVSQKEFAKARGTLQTYVRNHGDHDYVPDALYHIGSCSYRTGKYDDAAREFASFLNKHEKHPSAEFALVYLGDTRMKLNQPAEAAKSFRAALEQFGRGTMAEDARMGLARAYERQEKYAEAAAEYRVVVDDPRGTRRAEAQFQLAENLYSLQKYEEAAVEFDAFAVAFTKDERVPAAHLNAGFARFRAEDFAAARRAFDEAAKTESQLVRAEYWSGVSSKRLGDYEKAGESFAAAYAKGATSSEAPKILYQWADAEYLDSEFAEASKRFAELSEKFPKHELGDDALHEAGNAALRAGALDEAIQLITLFQQRYGKANPFSERQQILAGRIELARGKPGDLETAVKRFDKVSRETKDPATERHARYELARGRYQQGQYSQVVAALAPVLPEVEKQGPASQFAEAFLLQSDSQLALKKYEEADAAAETFFELRPKGPLAARAVANRAVARAHLGDRRQAYFHLTQLALLKADEKLRLRTRYVVAETAYAAKDFEWSSAAYQTLATESDQTSFEPLALNGLGWSLHEQKQYAAAAKAFGEFATSYDGDAAFRGFVDGYDDGPKLVVEARFMQGKSLFEDEQFAAAAKTFTTTFDRFAPETPAPKGADAKDPLRYVFLSGLQAARSLAKAGKVEEADAAYEKVTKTFPKYGRLDLLLDEWALLNYNAERFEKSDTLFRRILDEFPGSELADDARFQLAESANVAGRRDEAAREFAKLADDAKADPYVRLLSLFHLVQIEVARKDWKAVLARSKQYLDAAGKTERKPAEIPFVQFRTGEALLSLKRFEEARGTLEKLREQFGQTDVAKEPWFDRIDVLVAEAALESKDYDAAVSNVESLRKRSPDSPFLYRGDYLLGRVHMRKADFDLARAAFTRVVEDEQGQLTETAAMAQHAIGDSFFRQEDYKSAQREYFKVFVLYQFPQWQDSGLYNSAVADEQLGNAAAAAKAYQNLIERFPKSEFAKKARVRLAALGKPAP